MAEHMEAFKLSKQISYLTAKLAAANGRIKDNEETIKMLEARKKEQDKRTKLIDENLKLIQQIKEAEERLSKDEKK